VVADHATLTPSRDGYTPAHVRGYLFIADITGYTAYLSQSELDHARSTLEDLLNLLLREIHPPLKVSKLEGDAVLAYTPDGALFEGQTLVEMVERIYSAFRRALELMNVNTTCTCNACKNIPHLDLKFFVHHGEFALQALGQWTELVGTDVNLIHRLTKNSVKEATGWAAYAIYTNAAIEAAGLPEIAEEFTKHDETYDHIGQVHCRIQNMHPVWSRLRETHRVKVEDSEAAFIIDDELPVPQTVAWEYLTRPETRALLVESDRADIKGRDAGRLGTGSEYLCAHGDQVLVQTIVDWSPFDYYTYSFSPVPAGGIAICTVALEARGRSTHIHYVAKGAGRFIGRMMVQHLGRFIGKPQLLRGLNAIKKKIAEDLAAGVLQIPEDLAAPTDAQIRDAAGASLKSTAEA
jgi:hypothetical protein